MTGTSVLSLPSSEATPAIIDMSPHVKTAPGDAADTGTPNETMGGLHMIKERDDETDQDGKDAVRQQYENMTYDDLSHRMAENYKQLSAMLSTTALTALQESHNHQSTEEDTASTLATTLASANNSTDDLDITENVIANPDLDDKAKRTKMTKLFCRATSQGDLAKVMQLLNDSQMRAYIDIDARDEDGTTPLIYAACFGKVDIAQALLDAGAKTDVQDSFGWSALMWATNNNHDALVKVLLENGASSHTKSAKGRTVFDFVNTENQKIVEILATNPRDSLSSTSSTLGRTVGSLSSSSSNAGDYDFYYHSTTEGYDNFMAEEADRRKKLLETAMALAGGHCYSMSDAEYDDADGHDHIGDDDDDDNDDNDDDDDEIDEDNNEFYWDKCLPDQMFVFSADNLPYILNTVITEIQLPVRSRQEMCVPANVVFLSARFAHYFSSNELLQEVMEGAIGRISAEIKGNARNVHVLAFWITNATQLLYYLKKDAALVVATAEHQLRISELISEIYNMIIYDTEQRLVKILPSAIIDYEQIPGMDDVNFADDWQRFFRRSTRRTVTASPDGGLAVQMKRNASARSAPVTNPNSACSSHAASPQSVTSLLTSTLYVLQSYDVHPTIIIQALAQFFHYISCDIFNRILSNKKLLCRSKAIQMRINMSQLEDWICEEHLPSSLVTYLDPTNQLLQMLQCLTQLQDLDSFKLTVQSFDALNSLQLKRCVINYRYEVNEERLPDEVEKYVIQLAEETKRFKRCRSATVNSTTSTTSMVRSQSNASLQRARSRRESMSSLMGSLMSSVSMTPAAAVQAQLPSPPAEKEDLRSEEGHYVVNEEDEDDGAEEDLKETRDTKFMLPFSVPTTAHMVSVRSWAVDHGKREERLVSPVIPAEWMDRLDNVNARILD
ncbi:hypothetical protein BX666DRAFT_214314 [Dichotomocladium elegans]|nr:hypothetical protein BX666DRAFT_214314 [Dichotomocladium elegans]